MDKKRKFNKTNFDEVFDSEKWEELRKRLKTVHGEIDLPPDQQTLSFQDQSLDTLISNFSNQFQSIISLQPYHIFNQQIQQLQKFLSFILHKFQTKISKQSVDEKDLKDTITKLDQLIKTITCQPK